MKIFAMKESLNPDWSGLLKSSMKLPGAATRQERTGQRLAGFSRGDRMLTRLLFVWTVFTFILMNTAVLAGNLQRVAPPVRIPVSGNTSAWSDWPGCRQAALAGVAAAVANWQRQVTLKEVVINGAVATGGSVAGPPLQPAIHNSMIKAGVPVAVAGAFAAPVSRAWDTWAASLRVAGLNWYPAFACFAGPMAAPTPNVPTPLATLAGDPEPLSAHRLKAAIREALGPIAREPGAMDAVNQFADSFASRFTQFRGNVQVTQVIGSGRVPAWAPPYGPNCGAVVDGRGAMQPGGLVGAWPN